MPAGVTKALDYLRTRQRSDGGFSYSSSQRQRRHHSLGHARHRLRRQQPGPLEVGRPQPDELPAEHQPRRRAATNSGNAPEYYALCILAYRAANRTDLLTSAGSTQIDLVAKLESYQSLTGGFYSPSGEPAAATETTAWAVLGLVAAHQSGRPR